MHIRPENSGVKYMISKCTFRTVSLKSDEAGDTAAGWKISDCCKLSALLFIGSFNDSKSFGFGFVGDYSSIKQLLLKLCL